MFIVIALVLLATAVTGAPFFSVEAPQDANPCDYLPCNVGDQWTYRCQYTTAVGPEGHMIEQVWTSTVTVLEEVQTPEGTAIVREVKATDRRFEAAEGTPDTVVDKYRDTEDSRELEVYLIRGPYVYEIPDHGWDEESRQIEEWYLERLQQGAFPPEFFFPLGSARSWTNRAREVADHEAGELWKKGEGPAPNPATHYWHYSGVGMVSVPAGDFTGVHHLEWIDHTGHTDVWFKNGIGVIKRHYNHHGTYIESISELVQFRKADSKTE